MGGEGEESLEGASRAGSSEEEPAAPCARENETHGRRPKLCRLRTEQPRDGKAETRHGPREPEVRLFGHARGNAGNSPRWVFAAERSGAEGGAGKKPE